jgi:hypothetical protein
MQSIHVALGESIEHMLMVLIKAVLYNTAILSSYMHIQNNSIIQTSYH